MSVVGKTNSLGKNIEPVPHSVLERLHYLATSSYSPSTKAALIRSYVDQNARQPFYNTLRARADGAIRVITNYRPHKPRMHNPPPEVSLSDLGDDGVLELAGFGLDLERGRNSHVSFGDLQDGIDEGRVCADALAGSELLEGGQGLDELDSNSLIR